MYEVRDRVSADEEAAKDKALVKTIPRIEARLARQKELSVALLERMDRQEEIARARDANIQALLLLLFDK